MERLLEENSDLKKKYDHLLLDEKEKFEEIKKRLGLEFNVNQILKAKPNTKEHSYIMLH